MKISDDAVDTACRALVGVGWDLNGSSRDPWCMWDRERVRSAIRAALTVDGYPKLLSEALAVMNETGWPNAVDHPTSADGIIELAAYETYNELCRRVYHDGGIISSSGGLIGV